MSNQNNQKSDDMLKSYVAQIASQGVAMFLQQRQENEAERLDHADVATELRSRINWYTDSCKELEATIDEQKEQISRLSKINSSLRERIDRCHALNKSGSEQVEKLKKENDELKRENQTLRKNNNLVGMENVSFSNEILSLKNVITVLKNDRDDYIRRYEELRDRDDDHLADLLDIARGSQDEIEKGASA